MNVFVWEREGADEEKGGEKEVVGRCMCGVFTNGLIVNKCPVLE